MHKPSVAPNHSTNIRSVSSDATANETSITFPGVTVSSNIVKDGMEVRVVIPGDSTRRYRTVRVQHSGGVWFRVITPYGLGSVSGGANTGGTWDGAVYNMTEDTSLIEAVGDEIKVSGDVTGMVTAEETQFCIIHPVGVDPETGATQEDPCVPESRYIWGGGLYLSPIAGFTTNLGVEGAQPGNNMSGQHYMWNRVYDINTGRWTTPDPAAKPWSNLQDSMASNPIGNSDPAGLEVGDGLQATMLPLDDWKIKRPCGTFTWENLERKKGYDYAWWRRFDDGKAVMEFTVTFEPKGGACCACDKIVMIAFVKTEKRHRPKHWFVGPKGWAVDTSSGTPREWRVLPLFRGSKAKTGKCNPPEEAVWWDRPAAFPRHAPATMEFWACAICDDGSNNTFFGCMTFEISFDISGDWVEASFKKKDASWYKAKDFNADSAVTKWNNEVAENPIPTNLTDCCP